MRQYVFIGLLILSVMISGCSIDNGTGSVIANSQSYADSNEQSENLQTANVTIQDFAFYPSSTIISKGTIVVWTNDDSVPHSIDSDIGHADSDDIAPGETYSVEFDRPGTYKYHCGLHPSMKGTIIVE